MVNPPGLWLKQWKSTDCVDAEKMVAGVEVAAKVVMTESKMEESCLPNVPSSKGAPGLKSEGEWFTQNKRKVKNIKKKRERDLLGRVHDHQSMKGKPRKLLYPRLLVIFWPKLYLMILHGKIYTHQELVLAIG